MKSRNFLIHFLQWSIVVVAFYTFAGFVILSPVIKSVLTKTLSEELKRTVDIKTVNFNPYELSLYVNGLTIQDRENPVTFLSLSQLYVNIETASVLKKGPIVRAIKIYSPYINVIRNNDSSYNISDLLEQQPSEQPSESPPLRFSINNIEIYNGSIDFQDGPKNTMHETRELMLKIPMISNLPHLINDYVQPLFKATVNGTTVLLSGVSKPFSDSLETTVDLNINSLNIPHYLEYIPFTLDFNVLSGMIDTTSTLTFVQYKDSSPSLTLTGDTLVKDLVILDKEGNPLFELPALNISIALSDLTAGKIKLSDILVQSPKIHLIRDKDGELNLPSFSQPVTDTPTDKNDSNDQELRVEIEKLNLKDGTFLLSDTSFDKPVKTSVNKIELNAVNLSTAKGSKSAVSLAFDLNNRGLFSTEGFIGIDPLFTDLTLTVKDIDIIPLQPYYTKELNILITGGNFMTNGNFTLARLDSGELNAAYKGDVALSSFSSIDKAKSNDFLNWNSLYVKGINFEYTPLKVVIDEVSLTDFYSRLIVNSDGTLNVQGIVKDKEEEMETPAPEKKLEENKTPTEEVEMQEIRINAVTLQAGTVNFTDRHIKPNYTANLLEIGGRISGLSSAVDSRANVNLLGKLESSAPLEIKGSINPLSEDLFVDLNIDFHDMDLSPLTPYANKYVGYNIQKGKLSLELKYLIAQKKLDSTNNIFLDQFTFGEKVDSPDATKLPVKFAISLLKNRKGEISLDIPVAGNIDEPEFSIGGIIIKMLVNLLVKAATSPFALLGSLVGGGEELSYIDYEYGNDALVPNETAKLDKLSKALNDRPALNVDIEGYVDIVNDTEALTQYTFMKKLKARKLKEMVDSGLTVVPIDKITISPEEYEDYLRKAYKKETLPKPRNALGLAKKLPAPEMEKLMVTNIEINENDLRLLASKRALRVKDYFLNTGGVDPKRIFLIEPESLEPEKKNSIKNSRVDFKLK